MNAKKLARALLRLPPRELLRRAARRAAQRLDTASLDFPLLPGDIADSLDPGLVSRDAPVRATTGRARVGWVVVPPGAGSGGHTTLFRMMAAAHERGLRNTLLFYDRYDGDLHAQIETVRRAWPWLACDIERVPGDLADFDAVVASSWQTAHVVARRRVPGQAALYFAQDFEPYFSARGSEYAFAEDSYRLGLTIVALGRMVADTVRDEVGVPVREVPFGCDTDTYHLRDDVAPRRRGVLFYAKPGNERRGYRLAVETLARFHAARPDEPIHVYGDAARLPFPVVSHGNLPPERLNVLYNEVVAGLALSFTNISLVAEEMLAAGVVPVINDSPLARADLSHPDARWALPTPIALAEALQSAVDRPDRDAHARGVAARVTTAPWERTGALFTDILAAEIAALDPSVRTAVHS